MTEVWKQKRPGWCPHRCHYLMSVQGKICAGKLPKPEQHEGDFNTHRVCMFGVLPNLEVFDLQVNKTDLYHFERVFDAIKKDIKKDSK